MKRSRLPRKSELPGDVVVARPSGLACIFRREFVVYRDGKPGRAYVSGTDRAIRIAWSDFADTSAVERTTISDSPPKGAQTS